MICTLQKSLTWQCGLVAAGNGRAYILINKKQMAAAGVKAGDQVVVQLKVDESKYGMTIPPILAEVLRQDKEGKARFDKLVPGKQRYIIYYINQVKTEAAQMERALRIMHNIKLYPPAKITFAAMLARN